MDIENVLRSFRLGAPADSIRARVLRAARRAAFEHRLWRSTWAAAVLVAAAAVPINAALEPSPGSSVGVRKNLALVAVPVALDDQALRERLRLALSTRPGPRRISEVLP